MGRLHLILKPFMLRRIKKDVEHELTDKVIQMIELGGFFEENLRIFINWLLSFIWQKLATIPYKYKNVTEFGVEKASQI